MAYVRMTLDQAAAAGDVDHAKVDTLTEADIARFNCEDGFDPEDTMKGLQRVLSPAEIRRRVGLTQGEMASRLSVPVRTWRNWEQGRGTIEPAVRALLNILSVDPEYVFGVLSGFALQSELAGHVNRLVREKDDAVLARARVTSALEPITEEEIARLNGTKTKKAVSRIVSGSKKAAEKRD